MTVDLGPSYCDLFVVSDLHLGGLPGQQIFCQGPLLAQLIDYAAAQPARDAGRVGLVLAGDIVDFLAEPGTSHFKGTVEALGCLGRIVDDPAFAPVFQALRRFVQAPGHELCLMIGNHDLELALPAVQSHLVALLCDIDDQGQRRSEAMAAAARGRLRLLMDVSGLRCRVGTAQVLCLHGNEVDPWNRVAPGALTERCAAANRQPTPEPWIPNAGTQLVIDIMNPIKQRYPFVDLLKPEDEVVIPALTALDPGVARRAALLSLPGIGARWVRDTVGRWLWLGPDEPGAPSSEAGELAQGLGSQLGQPQDSAAALLAQAQLDARAGRAPLDLLARSGSDGQSLGQVSNVLGYLARRAKESPAEALREGLRAWLRGDKTYAPGQSDETATRIDDLVDPDIAVVIAGHTHLARSLPRRLGGRYYNAGTWIRLIRLDEAKLATAAAFQPIYQALAAGTLAALDACPGLIYHRPTVVRVQQDGAKTVHGLFRCQTDGQRLQLGELTSDGGK